MVDNLVVINPTKYLRCSFIEFSNWMPCFWWPLGRQITERGIGNGILNSDFCGYCCWIYTFTQSVKQSEQSGNQGGACASSICLCDIVFCCNLLRGFSWSVVNVMSSLYYEGVNKMAKCLQHKSSHLPQLIWSFIPTIFASSIILFPGTLKTMVWSKWWKQRVRLVNWRVISS